MDKKTVLVTGGAGFIGSNFILHFLENFDNYKVINFDKLTYAGNLANLDSVKDHPDYTFVKGDIALAGDVSKVFENFKIDYVVHFAAESHVDRSILGAGEFVRTNIVGTYNLLEEAKKHKIEKFVHVSTDEVYGSLGKTGKFKETTPLDPSSPYSASKASSDLLALSFFKTHGFPVVITRCSNNFGEYQFPEKLIPLMTINAYLNKKLPVYGTGENVRDWIYVKDHVRAIETVLFKGKIGEVYNIGGECEKTNIEIVKRILKILNRPESLITFVKDRPGHDKRYAMDISKIKRELGWKPVYDFEESLRHTVMWYIKNQDWWKSIMNKEYLKYYEKNYGNREEL